MAEWCNSFTIGPKPKGKVQLCLGLARLKCALLQPTHRGLISNDILPKLSNAYYVTIIDVSIAYHNLNLDKKVIIPKHLCMLVRQVHMQQITIWRISIPKPE